MITNKAFRTNFKSWLLDVSGLASDHIIWSYINEAQPTMPFIDFDIPTKKSIYGVKIESMLVNRFGSMMYFIDDIKTITFLLHVCRPVF